MENIIDRLKDKKRELDVTNAWIAEKSGVPESTVTKVFNGTNKSPTIATLGPIAAALGVSIDAGVIVSTDETKPGQPIVPEDTYLKMLIASYDRQLEAAEARIRRKNKWILAFAITFATMFFLLLIVLLYDATMPNIGWFQYQEMMRGMSVGDVLREMFAL